MVTDLAQREDILVSLTAPEIRSLFGVDWAGDLTVRLGRIPRSAKRHEHENALFSWLAANPANGKAFLANPRASLQAAVRAPATFLSPRHPEQSEGSQDVRVAHDDANWKTLLSLSDKDPICLLNTAEYVYAGTNGWIYQLLAADGTAQLRRRVGRGQVRMAISEDGAKLFVGNCGSAICVDTRDFSVVWWTEFARRSRIVNLLLTDTALYAGTRGKVYQLNPDKGFIVERNNLKRGNRQVRMALADDRSQLFIGIGGRALGLRTADLKALWQTKLPRTWWTPITVLTRDQSLYAAGNRRVFKLAFNGRVQRKNVLQRRGNRDVHMQFSEDGASLLLGTSGSAVSVDPRSLGTRWETRLTDQRGTPVSVLPRGDLLYAGSHNHFARLRSATGSMTFRKALGGEKRQEVGIALSPDGTHLRVACNGCITQTPAAGDLAAGWQAIAAIRRKGVNEMLQALFHAVPEQLKSSLEYKHTHLAAAPVVIRGETGRVTLKLDLKSDMIRKDMSIGSIELTIDLQSIQARIENDGPQDFVLAISLVSDASLFVSADLSQLKLGALQKYFHLPEPPELIRQLNDAVSHLHPLQFRVQKPLPISLNGLVGRFSYTNVPGDAESDFLSILFGLRHDEGSFDISPAVIGDGADTDTAFIVSNRLFMDMIQAGLRADPTGRMYGFAVNDAYPAHLSNMGDVRFRDLLGVKLRINERGVQIFADKKLHVNVRVLYKDIGAWFWKAVRFESATKFTSEGGNIRARFASELHVPWTFFLDLVTPFVFPLMIALRAWIQNLGDRTASALIFVPGFDVTGISLDGCVQITGKVNRDKKQ